jgi:hypothetical protein
MTKEGKGAHHISVLSALVVIGSTVSILNKRLIYGMRLIGQGRASAKRFCGIMNMPSPPKANAYSKNNKATMKAVKTVAEKSIMDASYEIHALKGSNDAGISQCGVSCDGTWQTRGHSSMNGCVTTLSIDTRKCLDVAVLSKVCRGCQRHKGSHDPKEKLVGKLSTKMNAKPIILVLLLQWKQWELRKYLAAVKRSTNYSIQSISAMGTAKVSVRFRIYTAKRVLK